MVCSLKPLFLAIGYKKTMCDGLKWRDLTLAETMATLYHSQ